MAIGDAASAATNDRDRDLRLATDVLDGSEEARVELGARLRCALPFMRAITARSSLALRADEVRDLAQDACATAMARLESFRGKATLETWIRGICRYEYLGYIRRSRRYRRALVNFKEWALREKLIDRGAIPVDSNALATAMRDIGLPASRVLELRYRQRMSFAEIGERMRMPVGTVRSHHCRALRRVRESFLDREGRTSNAIRFEKF